MPGQGKPRKKSAVAAAASNGGGEFLEDLGVGVAIANGQDLGPLIRKAFESGKPDSLLHQLRYFVKRKEAEIEDVCKLHYQEFIQAVDGLSYFVDDVHDLRDSMSALNSRLQDAGRPLLSKIDEYVEDGRVAENISKAYQANKLCYQVMQLCCKANQHIVKGNFYMVLKCLDQIERDFLEKVPATALKLMISKQIPAMRNHIQKEVAGEFNEWLVQIRATAKNVGQQAIGQASTARKKEEELRSKQREAEEQSRVSLRNCVYILETVETDDSESYLKFDLIPVYRAFHVNTCLGLQEQFKEYYYENRKLQLSSDFQISSSQPFLECYGNFFSQIAGFFIVEDRVQRTAGDLISRAKVEEIWDFAVAKMCSIIEDQFSRMQTANHLLLIKDYVSLLGVTLRRYSYQVDLLLEVLYKNRDKYHELLLNERRKQIAEYLANDNYDQMVMRKEYEYNMNVVAFNIQSSDIMPAFPYLAPFSSAVPECCRTVRSFIEDSVSYMSHGGQMDFYDVVKEYLDKLLTTVLNESLVKQIKTSPFAVSQAIQLVANMSILEKACEFFRRHAAQLCGIPIRLVERSPFQRVLKPALDAAEENMIKLVNAKAKEFMQLTDNINWTSDDVPQGGNEYVNELIIYLETLFSTAKQILVQSALDKLLKEVLKHVSDCLVATLVSDNVKRFNVNSVMGLDVDVKLLENFADDESQRTGLDRQEGAVHPKTAMLEIRQLINLLLSNQPENYMNPVIRERHYSVLDYKKVALVFDKFKESSDRLFGSFSGRTSKQNPKRKSIDNLVRRLKEFN